MAPKRGGGSGGGGGGGVSSLADSPWGAMVELPGRNFKNPYRTARLVFHAIALVGIVAIMIWARSFKKLHDVNRRVFRWYAFWLSTVALFVYVAMRFTTAVMYEVGGEVQVVYFLINQIIYESGFLAEITLLVVLFLLLPYCTSHPDTRKNRPSLRKGAKIIHALLIVILVALWLAAMALRIRYQVGRVIGDYSFYSSFVRSHTKIDTAYAILYFFAALEIAVWSTLGFINAKKQSQTVQVGSQNPTLTSTMLPLIFLAAIAAPLLLRSTYLMGATIHDVLLGLSVTPGLYLANDIIYNLGSLAIYGGIVAICWKTARSNPPPDDPNHSYDPKFWAAGGNPVANHDPKNPMAVNVAPPPAYQQNGGYPPMPPHQFVGHYASHPSPSPSPQQQMQHVQYQHPPYANQAPYQQPYPHAASPQYQQPYRGPGSPPPVHPQQPLYQRPATSPVHHQQQYQPSEVNGSSSVSELSSPTNTHVR
ncbi:MAG: hypothetical protein LQ341_006437 [Variospora aurantia]|nr:MAG: hypothetical protein LQ341_006437 [Variospora aurantia]